MIKLTKKLLYTTCFISMLYSYPVHAEGTFLLQVGSFDSRGEAEQKWKQVKSANSDLIGKLKSHISEVSMMGDGKASYRLQLASLSSRSKATGICASLQERGEECYVVETALLTEDSISEDVKNIAEQVSSIKEIPRVKNPVKEAKSDSKSSKGLVMVPGREPKFLDDAPASVAAPKVVTASDEIKKPEEEKSKKGGVLSFLFGDSKEETKKPESLEKPIQVSKSPEINAVPLQDSANSKAFGVVDVAEAIHVPLSQNKPQQQRHVSKKLTEKLQQIQPIESSPSSYLNEKNYWVQLNYFANDSQAQNFYENFREKYPELSDGIRMRITRPYSKSNSLGRVSLRVGPFASNGDVKTICSAAGNVGLNCRSVREVGASISANLPRTHEVENNFASEERQEKSIPQNVEGTYWIQLGTFTSNAEGWSNWKTMQKEHRKLLSRIYATVTTPPLSSATSQLFRLRAGPFTTQDSAYSLCDKLWKDGANCVIVKD